jgi:hypothetical protein
MISRLRVAPAPSAIQRNKLLRKPAVEALESRTMLSESASAQLTLTTTTGTTANPVYHYDITVKDTGTTAIGTFWFSWIFSPAEDFLPTAPLSESSPTGWAAALTGSNNSSDGTAIQWVATTNKIQPGATLGGFDFTSSDSPAVLAGTSPSHPASQILTSFVYAGAPLSDAGFQFIVAPAASTGQAATTTTLMTSNPSIQSGASVTLTATVAPVTPGGATPTGTVSFSQNGTAIGSAPVQSDGTAALPTTSLAAGTDTLTATYSGDSTYAGSTSTSVSETVTASPVSTALVPTITKSTLPAALVASIATPGVVIMGVNNPTANTVKGKVTAELFASTDGAIDGSSIELAQSPRMVNLHTGKSAAFVLPTRIPAGKLTPGSYTLLARIVDASGNNSDATSGPALTVAAPFVSLSETFTKVTIPASAPAGAKSRAFATLLITNNGNITTPGTTTAALFAPLSGVVDGNATLINSLTRALRIRAGKSMSLVIPMKMVPAIAVGTYTILAQVTDPNGLLSTAIAGTLQITPALAPSATPPASPPPTMGGSFY